MSAPVIESVSYPTWWDSSEQHLLPTPNGTQEGDLLVLVFVSVEAFGSSPPDIPTPWGFDKVNINFSTNNHHISVFVRRSQAGDPPSWLFNLPNDFWFGRSERWDAVMLRVSNAEKPSLNGWNSVEYYGGNSYFDVPSVTTSENNSLMLAVGGVNDFGIRPDSTGSMNLEAESQRQGGSSGLPGVWVTSEVLPNAGNSGTRTIEFDNNFTAFYAVSIPLEPQDAGEPEPEEITAELSVEETGADELSASVEVESSEPPPSGPAGEPPALEGLESCGVNTAGGVDTVSVPSGTQDGDLLIFVGSESHNTSFNLPSGFTPIVDYTSNEGNVGHIATNNLVIGYREANSGPSNYTVDFKFRGEAYIARITGWDGSTPTVTPGNISDALGTVDFPAINDWDFPSINATQNSLVLGVNFSGHGNREINEPTDWDLIYNNNRTPGGVASGTISLHSIYKIATEAGPTGAVPFTSTGNPTRHHSWTILVEGVPSEIDPTLTVDLDIQESGTDNFSAITTISDPELLTSLGVQEAGADNASATIVVAWPDLSASLGVQETSADSFSASAISEWPSLSANINIQEVDEDEVSASFIVFWTNLSVNLNAQEDSSDSISFITTVETVGELNIEDSESDALSASISLSWPNLNSSLGTQEIGDDNFSASFILTWPNISSDLDIQEEGIDFSSGDISISWLDLESNLSVEEINSDVFENNATVLISSILNSEETETDLITGDLSVDWTSISADFVTQEFENDNLEIDFKVSLTTSLDFQEIGADDIDITFSNIANAEIDLEEVGKDIAFTSLITSISGILDSQELNNDIVTGDFSISNLSSLSIQENTLDNFSAILGASFIDLNLSLEVNEETKDTVITSVSNELNISNFDILENKDDLALFDFLVSKVTELSVQELNTDLFSGSLETSYTDLQASIDIWEEEKDLLLVNAFLENNVLLDVEEISEDTVNSDLNLSNSIELSFQENNLDLFNGTAFTFFSERQTFLDLQEINKDTITLSFSSVISSTIEIQEVGTDVISINGLVTEPGLIASLSIREINTDTLEANGTISVACSLETQESENDFVSSILTVSWNDLQSFLSLEESESDFLNANLSVAYPLISVNLEGIEIGEDKASVSLNSSIEGQVLSQEIGRDNTELNVSVENAVLISVQETNADIIEADTAVSIETILSLQEISEDNGLANISVTDPDLNANLFIHEETKDQVSIDSFAELRSILFSEETEFDIPSAFIDLSFTNPPSEVRIEFADDVSINFASFDISVNNITVIESLNSDFPSNFIDIIDSINNVTVQDSENA